MTDPNFEWRSSDGRARDPLKYDPLRLTAQPPSSLLESVPLAELSGPGEAALLERSPAHSQRSAVAPVLQAAGLDRADHEQRGADQAQLAELRGGLPDGALDGALARQQARQHPQVPPYFATPAAQRAPGAHPDASDWVGLYAYEMHVQQQLGGGRGVDGRQAAAIQRRAATGLGHSYGDYTAAGLAPDERVRQFGGQLAALGEAPFGGQVNQVVLSRLPGADRPGVQAALLSAQGKRAALAAQDQRALQARALEGRLAAPELPLAGRLPPGTPPEVLAQLRRGLNAGPGGFAEAGGGLPGRPGPGSREGGTSIQVRGRREGGAVLTGQSQTGQVPAGGKTAAVASQTGDAGKATSPKTVSGKAEKLPSSPAPTSATASKGKKDVAAASLTHPEGEPTKTRKAPVKASAPSVGGSGGKASKVAAPGGSAASAAGGSAGGPVALRAIPLAQVPKSLNAQPVMQLEGQALFSEAEWKKLTKPVAQAGAVHPAPAVTPSTTSFAGTAPTIAGPRTATKPSPLSKLGHTISAAEIKKAEGEARKQAQSEMSGFVKRSQGKVQKLESAKKAIAPKVQGAAKTAQARIAGAARTATAQVSAAANSASAKARAAAAAAKAKINAEFASTVKGIQASTKSHEAELKAAHKAALQSLTSGLAQLNTATNAEFTAAQGRARTIASSEAAAAAALGESRARAYDALAVPKQSGWDDFVDGDDYQQKKHDARVQAARSVGKGYHDELLKSGNDYAAKLPEGQGKVQGGNQKLHDEHLKALNQQLTDNIKALHDAETQAVQSATTAKGQQLSAVGQQLSAALSGITQQKGSLTGQIGQQASAQQAAVGKGASSGVQGLQKAADTAISGLHKQITGIQAQLKGQGVPDIQALKASLGKADGEIAGGISAAGSSISGGAQKVAAGLGQQAASASSGLLSTAAKGAQGLAQAGAQAATGAAQVATSAATLLKGLGKGHETAAKALATKAKANITSVEKSFQDNGKKVMDGVKDQLQKATDSFKGEMDKARAGEDAKITSEANKAADQVQPRWKGWVSILIDIVIAVAVTALVIATGGVAGVVLGIVLGAVGGVLGQLAKDGLNGNGLSDWKTYAAAAVGGAIGGAVGAGGGALSGMLVKSLGTQLVKVGVQEGLVTVAKVGVDFVANNVTGLVGQTVAGFVNNKAFGTPFSLSEVFSPRNLAQNALMTGVGMGAGKYFEHNPGVPNALRGMMNKVPGVNITAPAPHLNTPETTGLGRPEANVTGSKTNVNIETPGVKATAGGTEAPTLPSTREAPTTGEPPRPQDMGGTPGRRALPPGKEPLALPPAPERLALPPAPERLALPAGKGEPVVEANTGVGGEPSATAPSGPVRTGEPTAGNAPEAARAQAPKRSGREIGEAGKPFEEQVQRETGGKSEVIEGREIDAVTDEALIQAKDVKTDNPRNFLSKSTRRQIKETVRLASERGKRAEFHFKEEPHPDVVQYIEERGGYVVSPSRPRPLAGTSPRTPVENPAQLPEAAPRQGKGTVGDREGLTGNTEGQSGVPEAAPQAEPTPGTQDAKSAADPNLNPQSVADLPGHVVGEHDYVNPGPLAPDKAATFVGGRYKVVELTEDLVVYRVGEMDKPLGQFFDTQKPASEIQSRIDKAVLPQWPGGGASPIDAVHAIRVPAGTKIYAGEVANQGGFYVGGTRQVVVLEPWKIGGLEVVSSEPINRIQVEPVIPAETVGGVQAITPKPIEAPQVEGPPGTGGMPGEGPAVPARPAASPEELSQGLPTHLRGRVPLEVNPELPGNTVRVKYEHENGVIKAVKLEAGMGATPRDIELHAPTVETMQKYTGLQGRVRSALDSLKRLVGLDGTPKLGTRAWEARLELQKLDAVIQDRQNALLASEDPAVRARLEADIANLEVQVRTHEDTLARMAQDPGAGYVAAEGIRDISATRNADVWEQIRAESPEQLQQWKNDYDVYLKDDRPFLRQKSRTETNQKLQIEPQPDGTFAVKPATDAPATLAQSGIDPAAPHEVTNKQVWESTEAKLVEAFEAGRMPPVVQERLALALKEDLTGSIEGSTPLPDARQRVVSKLNEVIGQAIADSEHPIQDLRQVLELVQQNGSQGSIAEHLAGKLYLDTEYVKRAFQNGQDGLILLERTQVIVDSFKSESQHGIEFKCGYENGQIDVNQARNYVRLIENGQLKSMDYLVMPNSKSNPEAAAKNIIDRLSVAPEVVRAVQSGDVNINFVDEQGRVQRIASDGSKEPVTLRR